MSSVLRSFAKRFVVDHFHKLYYNARQRTWQNTRWMGTTILKCPLDLWVYQEMLYEVRPNLIIETGTCEGGSAHFLASLCDLLGHGHIITIDIERKAAFPQHSRITYVTGSSTSDDIVERVRASVTSGAKVLVILDSDHSKSHVLREMELYSGFVSAGSYLVVEDTNINGHPVRRDFGPGPFEAVEEFLAMHRDFVRDDTKEKFFMTFNPRGYLKRVS